MTLHVKSPISEVERNTKVALRGNPRGVSSHHVLLRAFGDAYMRRENVRHATLLFCALERRALSKQGAGREENKMSNCMQEKDLKDIIVGSIKQYEKNFNEAWIKSDYKIRVGEQSFVVDLAIVDDEDTLYGAFEFKKILQENGTVAREAEEHVQFLFEKRIYCYLATLDERGIKILEKTHKGTWRSCRCKNCKLPKRIINNIVPGAKVRAKTVVEYLEKVVWAKYVLDCRIFVNKNNVSQKPWKFLFRGQCCEDWRLVPSLFRNFDKSAPPTTAQSLYPEELNMLYEAHRIAPNVFASCKTDIDRLTVAQHYEIPTRLLDVTGNALVALYFAALSGTEDNDGAVYVFGATQNDFVRALECCRTDEIRVVNYHQSDKVRMVIGKPVLVIPSFLTDMQRAQDGSFYLFENTADGKISEFKTRDYIRIVIPRKYKGMVLKELENNCNIHKGNIFPETLAYSKDKIISDAKSRIDSPNKTLCQSHME